MTRLMATLALLVLTAYLAILALWVPRLDLGVVLLVTLGFAARDLWGQRRWH